MRGIGRVLLRRSAKGCSSHHHHHHHSSSSSSSHGLVLKRSRAGAATICNAPAASPLLLSVRCLSGGGATAAASKPAGAEEGGSGIGKGTRAGVRPKGPGFVGRRGDSGRGWFQLYQEEGEEGFKRYRPPTPFDWEAAPAEVKAQRTRCYLEVSLDREAVGRIVIECADEILPMTVRNFALLCQQQGQGGGGYAGSGFHKIVKGGGIVGGDLAGGEQGPRGHGNHSALGARFFHDEGFIVPHSGPGLVSMVSAGVHRNAAHFHIATDPCPHLDGRAVAFGRVVEGMEVVKKVAATYSIRGRPVAAVKIEKAGLL